MTDRIKLEDMTLREIGELKCRMALKIHEALNCIVKSFEKSYDLGDVDLTVGTNIQAYKDGYGDTCIYYDVGIGFSKEPADKTYTFPDNPDPKFYKDMLGRMKGLCLDPAMENMVDKTLDKMNEYETQKDQIKNNPH